MALGDLARPEVKIVTIGKENNILKHIFDLCAGNVAITK